MIKRFIHQSFLNNLNPYKIITYATLACFVISIKIIYSHHGWVNNDFPLYHEAARLFCEGKWRESIEIYNWPTYPATIALTHYILKTNLLLSAQILSVLFLTLTLTTIMLIVKESGGSNLTITLSAFIFLSSTQLVGKIFPMLLKDPGFWLFHALSILFLMRFFKSNSTKDGVFWQLFSITSTLYRVEGIFYALLLPLIVTFNKKIWDKSWRLIKLYSVYILIILSLAAMSIFFSDHLKYNSVRLGDLFSKLLTNLLNLPDFLSSKSNALKSIFDSGFEDFYLPALLITYLSLVLIKLMKTAGWINIIFIMCTNKIKNGLDSVTSSIFLGVVLIATLTGLLTATSGYQLPSRYFSPVIFASIIVCSFCLEKALNSHKKGLRAIAYVFIAVNITLLFKNLTASEASNYQLQAANWIQSTKVPQEKIYINNRRLNFYASESFIESNRPLGCKAIKALVENETVNNYELVAILFKGEHLSSCDSFIAEHAPGLKLEKVYASKTQGDYIKVYKNKSN